MRKNPHDKILKEKSKEQHLSTVPESCFLFYYTYFNFFSLIYFDEFGNFEYSLSVLYIAIIY